MPANLSAIAQSYLDDTEFQADTVTVISQRDNDLRGFKFTVTEFISNNAHLTTLRTNLDKSLPTRDTWGLRGPTFLMEINKLAKNHAPQRQERLEQSLRDLLRGLNATNLGEHIEQCYDFLTEERTRLQAAGVKTIQTVSPANSALIMSVFAFWLDWQSGSIIYYQSLCRGLKMLIDADLLSTIEGLQMERDRIIVNNAVAHQAVLYLIEMLASDAPQLKNVGGRYWTERFFYWLINNADILEQEARPETETALVPASYERIIKHEPLHPVPAAELARNIAALRERILIDEKVVRRIYNALLSGHVILTGPPGTGKTELARLIPELLWQHESDTSGLPTAYATQLVTATDEWSVRTLIGGLTPRSINGQIAYTIQPGHLTAAIRSNWGTDANNSQMWSKDRVTVSAASALDSESEPSEFRGLWLTIDEFNRAPIDLALGDALTALGGTSSGKLRIPTESGSAELPIPRDFRIIGTLNSFDRNYLNQVSEALKRRFSFIEVLSPTRVQRYEEQAIVLKKAFESTEDIDETLKVTFEEGTVWQRSDWIDPDDTIGIYRTDGAWGDQELKTAFGYAWRLFEVIRLYRQLGTAQAITLTSSLLIAGLQQIFNTPEEWLGVLDTALCDTIADQLQVLLPYQLEVLYWYLRHQDKATFIELFNKQLGALDSHRLRSRLEALSGIVDDDGQEILTEEQIDEIAKPSIARVPDEVLTRLFRLDEPRYPLPEFARRLRTFKAERGL